MSFHHEAVYKTREQLEEASHWAENIDDNGETLQMINDLCNHLNEKVNP